jgi:hypothetical protein
MTPEEIRKEIHVYLDTNWSATGMALQNRAFDPPIDDYWIRATILPGEVIEGELGENGVGLRSGVLMIDVFGPRDVGTKQFFTYANQLEGLFRRKDLNGVLFGEPSTIDLGDEENWYHVQVSVNFNTFVGE